MKCVHIFTTFNFVSTLLVYKTNYQSSSKSIENKRVQNQSIFCPTFKFIWNSLKQLERKQVKHQSLALCTSSFSVSFKSGDVMQNRWKHAVYAQNVLRSSL